MFFIEWHWKQSINRKKYQEIDKFKVKIAIA